MQAVRLISSEFENLLSNFKNLRFSVTEFRNALHRRNRARQFDRALSRLSELG
jgi:hypothetical protein